MQKMRTGKPLELTLNLLTYLVAAVNTFNTKTHSSKEMTGFCFVNADAKSILRVSDQNGVSQA